MDSTIRNSNDLVKALQHMSTGTNAPKRELNGISTAGTYVDDVSASSQQVPLNAPRQMSTNQLLKHLCALQTRSNAIAEAQLDAMTKLTSQVDRMVPDQAQNVALLSSIARNTASSSVPLSTVLPGTPRTAPKTAVKDYGMNNPADLAAELLLKVLRVAETMIKLRGIDYRSSRTCNRSVVSSRIRTLIATNLEYRGYEVSSSKFPENKDNATLKVASRVGTVDGFSSVLTAESIRDLMLDPECRTFVAASRDVVERMKIVRLGIPYYEADILEAIEYPYFNSAGELICEWGKLNARTETEVERKVSELPAKSRETLIKYMGNLCAVNLALTAISKKRVVRMHN